MWCCGGREWEGRSARSLKYDKVELSRLEVEACAKREARESGSCGAEVHDMLEDRKGR